jgi:hypothetical protein
MKGVIPPHLQAHLNTLHFHRNMRAKSIIYRCVNTRNGHTSKGHQMKTGIIFNHGPYFSTIPFKKYRNVFLAAVYFELQRILSQLGQSGEQTVQQLKAHKLHRETVKTFYSAYESAHDLKLPSHDICVCCLSSSPEHALSCGDVLCSPCIQAYGRSHGRSVYEVQECPVGFRHAEPIEARFYCLKPASAGVRLLSLDDGGIQNITQLEILRQVERELLGKIPIRCLFDIVAANGAASIIALAISSQSWTLNECIEHFQTIMSSGFDGANLRKMRKLPGVPINLAKYHSATLEEQLRNAFGPNTVHFGPNSDNTSGIAVPKVMITSENAEGGTAVFTSYHRGDSASCKLTRNWLSDILTCFSTVRGCTAWQHRTGNEGLGGVCCFNVNVIMATDL